MPNGIPAAIPTTHASAVAHALPGLAMLVPQITNALRTTRMLGAIQSPAIDMRRCRVVRKTMMAATTRKEMRFVRLGDEDIGTYPPTGTVQAFKKAKRSRFSRLRVHCLGDDGYLISTLAPASS